MCYCTTRSVSLRRAAVWPDIQYTRTRWLVVATYGLRVVYCVLRMAWCFSFDHWRSYHLYTAGPISEFVHIDRAVGDGVGPYDVYICTDKYSHIFQLCCSAIDCIHLERRAVCLPNQFTMFRPRYYIALERTLYSVSPSSDIHLWTYPDHRSTIFIQLLVSTYMPTVYISVCIYIYIYVCVSEFYTELVAWRL